MKRFRLLAIFFSTILLFSFQAYNQNLTPIILDEAWDEWSDITDIANVGTSGNATIKVINTTDHLFIYLETADVLSIQNDARIKLYLDTDNNSGTGLSVNGIGAEVEVDFGIRTVTTRLNGNENVVGFRAIELAVMPTVWSDKFEIAIQRNAQIDGDDVFTGNDIKVIVEDQGSQTYSPAATGGASYSFGDYTFDPLPTYTIEKVDGSQLRMISYNVLRDNIFDESVKENFRRILQTTDPDIIGFQEIYDHSGEDVAALMEEFLPSGDGEAWYGSKVHDNIVVSRFAIESTHFAGTSGNGGFLINLRPTYDTELLLVNAHTPCCNNDAGRTTEIDAMMEFVRNAKDGTGQVRLEENAPIVIMGDMNLVGNPQQTLTLKNGDIQDEATYGADFTPDWNGENFKDALPIVTGAPMTFTHWSSTDAGKFSSGRLDIIVYAGSGLTLENGYVLYTETMDATALNNNGLQQEDCEAASDHLPLVVDFTVTAQTTSGDISMLDLRENDAEGIPLMSGQTVTVSGIVTVDSEFGNLAYIQNDEAGIAIFGNEFPDLFAPGDSIEITSVIGQFNGSTQLQYDASITQVSVLKAVDLPEPKVVNIADVLNQSWNGFELIEGTLVKFVGVEIEESGTFAGGTNYTVSDGVNSMTLRVDGDTNIAGEIIPNDQVDIIGIISQFDNVAPYDQGYQILPRSLNDIVEAKEGIAAVRENNTDGSPALDGVTITASGVITANQFGGNGPVFMQNESMGVALFGADLVNGLSLGDSVSVTTNVGFFNGLTELIYVAGVTNVNTHKSTDVPAPTPVTIAQILAQDFATNEPYESLLIALSDISFAETGQFEGNSNYTVSDGTASLTVRIDADTDIAGMDIPENTGTLVGVLSQFDNSAPYSDGYQLMLRSQDDFEAEVIASINDDPGLDLYPNPSNGILSIHWKGQQAPQAILIFDVNGKLIIMARVGEVEESITISTDHLSPGVYNCQIQLVDRTINRKLIVE